MRLLILPLAAVSTLALAGCIIGPNCTRPRVDVPHAYHGPDRTVTADKLESLGNAQWWTVFQDPELQKLVHIALEQNFDLQIAASRVMQAQQGVTIARSAQFPMVGGGVLVSGLRTHQLRHLRAATVGTGLLAWRRTP